MLLTKRKLLIGIAISETLNSKQFYELFQKLNDDVSLNHPFLGNRNDYFDTVYQPSNDISNINYWLGY